MELNHQDCKNNSQRIVNMSLHQESGKSDRGLSPLHESKRAADRRKTRFARRSFGRRRRRPKKRSLDNLKYDLIDNQPRSP
jgi:hypothetical protein